MGSGGCPKWGLEGPSTGKGCKSVVGSCAGVDSVLQLDLFPPEPVCFGSAMER